jgi:hypothetical protein
MNFDTRTFNTLLALARTALSGTEESTAAYERLKPYMSNPIIRDEIGRRLNAENGLARSSEEKPPHAD